MPRETREKPDLLNTPLSVLYDRCYKYWHIMGIGLTVIYIGSIYIDKVLAYDGRIVNVETSIKDLPKLQQRVDDIADFLGVPKNHKKY